MKNKLLFANVILTLTISMTACGQTNNEIEDTASIESIAVAESSIENVSEAESSTMIEDLNEKMTIEAVEGSSVTETEIQSDIETIVDETEENESDVDDKNFTEEEALEKVHKLMDAYHALLASNDETAWNILDRCERLEPVGHIIPTTKDGFELNNGGNFEYGSWLSFSVGVNYFYNYVNNNSGYYDFTEYIESHTLDEILYSFESKESWGYRNEETASTDYFLFGEAIGVIPYIDQFENIEVAEFIEGENCTHAPVSEIEVGYELVLSLDGENSGLRVVFDKEGNMLNINTENAYDKFDYIFTFSEAE